MAAANSNKGLKKLLGDYLIDTKDNRIDVSTVAAENEVIALQFSAHWCGPCRQFTPMLIDVYKDLRAKNKKFQVVFISSDKDQEKFDEYFAEMPWLALPFDQRDLKNKLSKKFKIQGIPSVVFVNGDGKLISKNGRELIMSAPDQFPWPQKSLLDTLGTEFVRPNGDKVTRAEALDGKYVGILFSAHWCPPCKIFTPQLIKTYTAIQGWREDFEIVFVSSDRDADAFKHYHGSMPWLAVPYEDRDRKNALSQLCEVEGIPTFVLMGPDGQLITTSARAAASADPEGLEFPWLPKVVNNLNNPERINEATAVVVFVEKESKDDQAAMEKTLVTIAESLRAKKNEEGGDNDDDDDDDDDLLFYIATDAEGVAQRIRALTKVTKDKAMVVLDIPDNGGFYTSDEVPTEDSIRALVTAYKQGKLERKQLGQ